MVLSLCAVLLLAGCARFGGGGASRDEPSAGTSGEPPIAIPDPLPPSPKGDGSQRVEPDASVFDAHEVSIDHFTIGPDGRTLAVYWWGGNVACFGLKEVRVGMQRSLVASQPLSRQFTIGAFTLNIWPPMMRFPLGRIA